MKRHIITNPKVLNQLFIISWLTYFVSYIGRLNYAASMIEIGRIEGYSTSQLGIIVTAMFISYGISQLVSGILGDCFLERRLVGIGLVGCACCNLLVVLSNSFMQLVFAWFINGFVLSFIWPPMIKLFSKYMPKDYLHKCCFHIQTSVAAGTFVTYLFCSFLIAFFHWKSVFLNASILLFIMAAVWYKKIEAIEDYAKKFGEEEVYLNSSVSSTLIEEKEGSVDEEKSIFIKSGLVFILIAVLVIGLLKDGVMTWVPQYITDTFEVNTYFSIFLTALLPLVNLLGIYAIKYINKKNKQDDLKTSILFYLLSMISLGLLVLVGTKSIYLAIFLFSIVTSCMLGINTILGSVVPLYFAKYNKIATVTGVINGVTYLGSALCGYGLGSLAECYGWKYTIMALTLLCGLGIGACVIGRPIWNKFKAN